MTAPLAAAIHQDHQAPTGPADVTPRGYTHIPMVKDGFLEMFQPLHSWEALSQVINFDPNISDDAKNLILLSCVNPIELTFGYLSQELRFFADRSVYDAYATVLMRNGIQTKRRTRKYSLDSVIASTEGSLYSYTPDTTDLPKLEEHGLAAITKLFHGKWVPHYMGIRDSYLLVSRNGIADAYIDLNANVASGSMTISIFGHSHAVNQVLSIFKQNWKQLNERKADRLELKPDGSISVSTISLKDPDKYARGIYPNLKETPEELWLKFAASESRAMLFWGVPGCGKSSFASAMLVHRGYDKLLFVDDSQLYENPTLINTIRGAEDGTLVVFEDADILLAKRADGNKQMSGLLNVISGVAERDIRFLFLANIENERDMDSALARGGRMYRSIKFLPMVKEDVNTIRTRLGLPELSEEVVNSQKDWTLADIAHYGDGVKQQGIGYSR